MFYQGHFSDRISRVSGGRGLIHYHWVSGEENFDGGGLSQDLPGLINNLHVWSLYAPDVTCPVLTLSKPTSVPAGSSSVLPLSPPKETQRASTVHQPTSSPQRRIGTKACGQERRCREVLQINHKCIRISSNY